MYVLYLTRSTSTSAPPDSPQPGLRPGSANTNAKHSAPLDTEAEAEAEAREHYEVYLEATDHPQPCRQPWVGLNGRLFYLVLRHGIIKHVIQEPLASASCTTQQT